MEQNLNRWDDLTRRLAREGSADWPLAFREALRTHAPPPPARLDDRMGALFARSAGQVLPLPARRRLAPFAYAAAAIGLLVLGGLLWNWPGADFVVLRSQGRARILTGDGARPIDSSTGTTAFAPGARLELEDGAVLEFSYKKDMHVQLIGPARVEVLPASGAGARLALRQGELFFVSRATGPGGRLNFLTDRARYDLAGTAGLLVVKEQVQSVWVVEGALEVHYRSTGETGEAAGTDEQPDAGASIRPLRITEGYWALVDRRTAGDPEPELFPIDAHSFQAMCHRRDRLLGQVRADRKT